MVSDGGPCDRGQLILIGAVAIAFILLGIVVVFNSVLYTQTIASSDTVESGVDAQTTELELERGGSRLTQVVNRKVNASNEGDLEDELFDSNGPLWEFVDQYGQTKAAAKPTVIDVDDSSGNITELGRLIYRESPGDLTNGEEDFDVFGNGSSSSPERKLGRLTMTIEVDSMDELEVTLQDADDDTKLEFERDDDNGNLTVGDCELVPRSDQTVQVNLHDGTWSADGADDECHEELDLTSDLDNRYTGLEFDGDAEGTYEVVVKGDDDTNVSDTNHLAVWSYEFDYRYDTAEVSYSRTIEVDVYGGDS